MRRTRYLPSNMRQNPRAPIFLMVDERPGLNIDDGDEDEVVIDGIRDMLELTSALLLSAKIIAVAIYQKKEL